MLSWVIELALQVAFPKSPLMQCPPTLQPVVLVFVEPSNGKDSYIPVFPTDSKQSFQKGGIPVSLPNIIDKGPWVINYSAENTHRPSHRPAFFDTE